jgi:hypothetical protein
VCKIFNRFIALAFLVMVAPAAIAQGLGFALMDGHKKVEIPVEINNNLIVVPIILNSSLPLKFILDTGVRTAILTQKSFSDILNLPYTRRFSISGVGVEKTIEAYVTNNVSFTLPGVHGKGHALLVLEEDYLELRNYLGTDVHGILGYELFSRFIVQIDYQRRVVTLFLPSAFKKKKNFDTLPITIEDTKPYVVIPITLENGETINAKLLMDSGASHSLLLDPLSDDRIEVPPGAVSSPIGRGLGGEILGKAGRIHSMQFGKYKIPRVITNFPDPNSYSDTSAVKVFRNGTMGGELLSRFTVIYNFPKQELYFKKNSDLKKSFYYNLSGLNIKSKGAKLNVFEITGVRTNSPSEKAGLKVGDTISEINGLNADLLDLGSVLSILNRKPGKKIKLEVMREGKKIKTSFVLTDQV